MWRCVCREGGVCAGALAYNKQARAGAECAACTAQAVPEGLAALRIKNADTEATVELRYTSHNFWCVLSRPYARITCCSRPHLLDCDRLCADTFGLAAQLC